jgi:Asp-tRNA(Asn)/Glu-tRNA(Gln) amidotransferase A subunit family amidase
MPIGIKDIFETADMPTEQGSPLFVGWRSPRDSAAVAALREAGAVIVGKTVTTEFAATEPGPTTNPWDHSRTPGGSSSGSAAAVAAGLVPAALGTQLIGSIIRPSSYCGCYGFKPSVGGINRGGSFDYFSQSCTGTLAATLEELWIVARAIATRVGGDPGFPGISGPVEPPPSRLPKRVAVLETAGFEAAIPGAVSVFLDYCERLKQLDVEILTRKNSTVVNDVEHAIYNAESLARSINAWESRWPLNTYARDIDINRLSSAMRARLEIAEAMTMEEHQERLTERARIRNTYSRLASACDACITLSATGPAPIGLESTGNAVFAIPASLLGVPAISIPRFSVQGLPLGLQIFGFIKRDADLMSVAATLEQV